MAYCDWLNPQIRTNHIQSLGEQASWLERVHCLHIFMCRSPKRG